jgi:hypothetical protein
MKAIFTKKHQHMITAVLVGLILLAALFFPSQIAARQSTPEPTPTSSPLPDEQEARYGDTDGLILGAGVILIIILGGVLVQRVILRPDSNNEEN